MIEGPDLTGKSTLAARLAPRLLATVVHAGKPTQHPVVEYETTLTYGLHYEPQCGTSVILDRWHLGEHVWPTIFERKTALDLAVARHLELFMMSRGAVYVVGDRDDEKLKRELVAENEPLRPQDLSTCKQLFRQALDYSHQQWLRWDYESMGDLDVARITGAAIRAEFTAGPVFDHTSEWIGSPNPFILLVGEQPASVPRGQSGPGVPFAPYPATAGHYLMRTLPAAWWHEVAIVNTFRENGERQPLTKIWAALGAPHVIALGRVAREALEERGIPHGSVPHPQWWRRFKHHDVHGYTDALMRARRGEHVATPGV